MHISNSAKVGEVGLNSYAEWKVKSKLSIDFTKAALANVRIHFMADTS